MNFGILFEEFNLSCNFPKIQLTENPANLVDTFQRNWEWDSLEHGRKVQGQTPIHANEQSGPTSQLCWSLDGLACTPPVWNSAQHPSSYPSPQPPHSTPLSRTLNSWTAPKGAGSTLECFSSWPHVRACPQLSPWAQRCFSYYWQPRAQVCSLAL